MSLNEHLQLIGSTISRSYTTDSTIITEVVKNALNEAALCGLAQTSGLPINLVSHKQFMVDLADQVLTAASEHDIKSANTVFVLADSELPKTVARVIDLRRIKKDRIDREMESVVSER